MKVGVLIFLFIAAVSAVDTDLCGLDDDTGCFDYSSAESCRTTPLCKAIVWNQPVNNNTKLCQMCIDDVTNLQQFISAKSTRQFVKYDLLAKCRFLPFEAARNKCRSMINKNFDKIYQDIVDKLDPNVICRALRFCRPKIFDNAILDNIDEILPEYEFDQCKPDGENGCKDYSSAERCQTTDFCKSVIWNQPINNVTKLCQMCLDDVANLQKFIEANSTREYVKAELMAMCSAIPFEAARNRCKTMIDQNFDIIYEDIIVSLDPDMICRALHFCCSKDSRGSLMNKIKKTVAKAGLKWQGQAKYAPSAANDIMCDTCTFGFKELETVVDVMPKNEIKKELLAFCDALPDVTMRQPCHNTIDADFEEIYKELVQKMDPAEICKKLGLCGGKTPDIPAEWRAVFQSL